MLCYDRLESKCMVSPTSWLGRGCASAPPPPAPPPMGCTRGRVIGFISILQQLLQPCRKRIFLWINVNSLSTRGGAISKVVGYAAQRKNFDPHLSTMKVLSLLSIAPAIFASSLDKSANMKLNVFRHDFSEFLLFCFPTFDRCGRVLLRSCGCAASAIS